MASPYDGLLHPRQQGGGSASETAVPILMSSNHRRDILPLLLQSLRGKSVAQCTLRVKGLNSGTIFKSGRHRDNENRTCFMTIRREKAFHTLSTL